MAPETRGEPATTTSGGSTLPAAPVQHEQAAVRVVTASRAVREFLGRNPSAMLADPSTIVLKGPATGPLPRGVRLVGLGLNRRLARGLRPAGRGRR